MATSTPGAPWNVCGLLERCPRSPELCLLAKAEMHLNETSLDEAGSSRSSVLLSYAVLRMNSIQVSARNKCMFAQIEKVTWFHSIRDGLFTINMFALEL